MKKSTIKQIEAELDKKTKLPLELKDEIRKEIFTNISIAIVLIIYFIFLILGSVGTSKNIRTVDFNIFSIVFLATAIILFEYSYKKEKGKMAIYGIESLAVAIFTLFLPYIIFELDESYKKYYLLVNVYIGIYYLVKSICIYINSKNKFMNSISDVKEIVKKDKPKRRNVENLEESKIGDATHSEPKQKQDKENDKSKAKKRGRPKKTEVKNSKNIVDSETKPKKRGRPRKVVESND